MARAGSLLEHGTSWKFVGTWHELEARADEGRWKLAPREAKTAAGLIQDRTPFLPNIKYQKSNIPKP